MALNLRSLDTKDPGSWPRPVKALAAVVVAAVVLLLGWQLVLSGQGDRLESLRAEEGKLREEFEIQATRAANLEPLKRQLEEMEAVLAQQLRQLPTKTQMPELIVDISRSALTSGIHTELFQPNEEVTKEFYAEKPIALRMIGTYHQFGDFVSTVAGLPRVVILASDNLTLKPRGVGEDGAPLIVLEGTVKTFRSLDEEETLEQEKLAEEARKRARAEEAKRKRAAAKKAKEDSDA